MENRQGDLGDEVIQGRGQIFPLSLSLSLSLPLSLSLLLSLAATVSNYYGDFLPFFRLFLFLIRSFVLLFSESLAVVTRKLYLLAGNDAEAPGPHCYTPHTRVVNLPKDLRFKA